MKVGKIIRNVVLGLAGVVLLLLVAIQLVMRPAFLTKMVNRLAAEYVEGSVNFSEVKLHVLKSFPYAHLEASDFNITYPHERYARYDSLYPDPRRRFSLLRAGYGTPEDTLASFRELDLWLDYMALVRGQIHVHKLRLTRPRIFAHYFDSTAANWDILPIGSSKEESADTISGALPAIKINQVELSDRPLIIFTDPVDTLHGLFSLRRLSLNGKINLQDLPSAKTRLEIDSLLLSGRLPSDTLALRLHSMRAQVHKRHVQLDARAETRLLTRHFGRLAVPIELEVDAEVPQAPEGELGAQFEKLRLQLSAVNLQGAGKVYRHASGLLDLDVKAAIEDCPLGEVIREYRPNIPALQKLDTDARLSLQASAKGTYGQGQLPIMEASVRIPMASVDYEGLGRKGRLALDASVSSDARQEVDATVRQLLVDILGAKINLKGSAEDVLGKDPLLQLTGNARARVDSLTGAFTAQQGITGTGTLTARLNSQARLSQLNLSRIGNASIDCQLLARDVTVEDAPDQLSAFLPKMEVNLSTRGNQIDSNLRKGARVLALKADIDTVSVQLEDMFVRGSSLQLLAQNSAEILRSGKELTPLMGILKVGRLGMRDQDGLGVGLWNNVETFRITPASSSRPTPQLRLRSRSQGIRLRRGGDLYGLRDLNFDLSAERRTPRKDASQRRSRILDSLQRVYPGVERDSLFAAARRARLSVEDPFAGSDIHISLGNSVKRYLKEWNIAGELSLGDGRIVMPAFPLPTQVSAVKGSFTGDELVLGNITVESGQSDLSAQAHLTGLRRALIGRGRSQLKLKADVQSNYIDVNELLRAYAYYASYTPPQALSEATDEAVEQSVEVAQLPDSVSGKLIVIPSNLEVDFSLEASGIKYDSLQVSWAAADVAMRDRTLQITNALAASNMGDIYFEGFYSTRSKEEIKGGFDLNLVNITAEKVITLFPAVDTLMPMLTTFAGNLDCELAATSDIDTTMNLVLPSIDGILKISGKDLELKESEEFTKIARLLLFKNRSHARIDNMSVTGLVQDNVIEIFPFVLDIDRYTAAASGTQHLDQRFDYHISIIKSPLIVKFGLNAWGNDFDHIHYGLGRARYRSANVPVYTKQLNQMQYNLVGSIHNIFELGVEKAMAENRAKDLAIAGDYAAADTTSSGDIQETLQRMETLLDDASGSAESRKQALKQTILRLQEKAAKSHEQ